MSRCALQCVNAAHSRRNVDGHGRDKGESSEGAPSHFAVSAEQRAGDRRAASPLSHAPFLLAGNGGAVLGSWLARGEPIRSRVHMQLLRRRLLGWGGARPGRRVGESRYRRFAQEVRRLASGTAPPSSHACRAPWVAALFSLFGLFDVWVGCGAGRRLRRAVCGAKGVRRGHGLGPWA